MPRCRAFAHQSRIFELSRPCAWEKVSWARSHRQRSNVSGPIRGKAALGEVESGGELRLLVRFPGSVELAEFIKCVGVLVG